MSDSIDCSVTAVHCSGMMVPDEVALPIPISQLGIELRVMQVSHKPLSVRRIRSEVCLCRCPRRMSVDMPGKHLRTHSFRATLITELLTSTRLDQVKELIGHSDIKSTLTHKRGGLSQEQQVKVLNNLDNVPSYVSKPASGEKAKIKET